MKIYIPHKIKLQRVIPQYTIFGYADKYGNKWEPSSTYKNMYFMFLDNKLISIHNAMKIIKNSIHTYHFKI